VIARVLDDRRPTVFLDVGCAEGYYAVGFALSAPETEVFAYDIARSGSRILPLSLLN